MQYDLIILGGGPAGCSAAIYAARKKLNTLFLTKDFESQSAVSEQIFNWIGTNSLSGRELADNLKKHVLANTGKTLEMKEGAKAVKVSKNGTNFIIEDQNGNKYESKTVLVATGSGRRKLEAKNADKFEHKGVTYCASCDGPIFEGQDVIVIGGGNAAFETAAQLLAYCSSVTLVNRSDKFRADEITVEKVLANPKMKVVKNIDILEVKGDKFVEGLIVKDKATLEEMTISATGIFVEIGQIPNTELVDGLLDLDPIKKIVVDPYTQAASVPGAWAAGDCTNGLYHQNNIAAGDAVKALENLYLYLNTR